MELPSSSNNLFIVKSPFLDFIVSYREENETRRHGKHKKAHIQDVLTFETAEAVYKFSFPEPKFDVCESYNNDP